MRFERIRHRLCPACSIASHNKGLFVAAHKKYAVRDFRVYLIHAPRVVENSKRWDYAVNDEPQPQLPVEFGFVKVNPEPITPVT